MTLGCRDLYINLRNSRKKYTLLYCKNFEAKENAVTLILGKSGTGKTLLSLMLSGITYNGDNIYIKDNDESFKINNNSSIFYTPTTSLLYNSLTLIENIDFYCSNKAKVTTTLIKIFGFDDAFLNKKPNKLSQGERKIVSFLIALYSTKEIVLLDEPFADIDKSNIQICINLIKESKKTIIIFDHEDLNYINLYSRKYIIKENKLVLEDDSNSIVSSDYSSKKTILSSKSRISYYFKIALYRKRFLFSALIEASIGAITFLILNLLLNLTFINVDINHLQMKENLFNTYLISFLIALLILLIFKFVFNVYYLKSYKTTLNLFTFMRLKKRQCLLFIFISQIPFLLSFIVIYFALFYSFLYSVPFLLNQTFYLTYNYQDYLVFSTLISLICFAILLFVFISSTTLMRFVFKGKIFSLEEN